MIAWGWAVGALFLGATIGVLALALFVGGDVDDEEVRR